MRIKTFTTTQPSDLDKLVNDFIENEVSHLEDIKFSMYGNEVGAMIIYRPVERCRSYGML